MKIKKIPNILTTIRIGCVPIILLCFLVFDSLLLKIVTCFIFCIASCSDFLDGYIARKFNAETAFGKCFDPVADKLIVTSVLIMLIYDERAWVLPCLIIILRDIVISGIREFLAKDSIKMNVSFIAKLKTTLQMIAIIILLLSDVNNFLYFFGNLMLFVSALLTLYTMYDYIRKSYDKIKI